MTPCGSKSDFRPHTERFYLNLGSWPLLVKRRRLEVSQRFSVHRRIGKTALLLKESPSIPLVEVPVVSTSPKVAKSLPSVRMNGER